MIHRRFPIATLFLLVAACSVDQAGTSATPSVIDTGAGGDADLGPGLNLPDGTDGDAGIGDAGTDDPSEGDVGRDTATEDAAIEDGGGGDLSDDTSEGDVPLPDLPEGDVLEDGGGGDTGTDVAGGCDPACGENEECLDTFEGAFCFCLEGFEREGFECVEELEPAWITVEPDRIDFGEMGLFASTFTDLTITNTHESQTFTVFSVALDQSSQGFRVFSEAPYPVILGPGESGVVEVRFRPMVLRAGGRTDFGNTVIVETNEPDHPSHAVPLTGVGVPDPVYCLNWEWSTLDLGDVDPEDSESRTVELRNCGSESLTVTGTSIDEGSWAPGLSVEAFSGTLEAEASVEIDVIWEPTDFTPLNALVNADSEEAGRATMLVHGGPSCPFADIDLESELPSDDQKLVVEVGEEVSFTAADSDDPADGDLLYTWSVTPEDGDFDLEPSATAEVVEFIAEGPGEYVVQLAVESEVSGLNSCNQDEWTVVVIPAGSVRVELTWDNQADLDLHMIRTNTDEFPEFGNRGFFNPDAAYWNNHSPDWGVADDESDDPWFLGDDRNGFGPEIIIVPGLEEDYRYRVGVNYADRNGTGSVEPMLTVTINDVESVFETERSDQGFWVPIEISGAGVITELD